MIGWVFYCQITADEQGNVNICSSVLIGYNVVVDRKAAAHWSTVWSSGTFSSISGGPRCLKYQNVPKLRSFWPRSRFQSRVIKVYFLTVPDNHSVANKTSYYVEYCAKNGWHLHRMEHDVLLVNMDYEWAKAQSSNIKYIDNKIHPDGNINIWSFFLVVCFDVAHKRFNGKD